MPMYGQKKATKKAAPKGPLKRQGAGDPNYIKDMIKKGKAKPKPGMMK